MEHEGVLRALEEQRRERESAMIKLKRVRNSLLNISKLPPEILGNIFRWNVSFEDDFGGLGEESHNFLFVCHHWSEVASHTPELWSFWGRTLEDWTRWCRRSGTAPLDLVLDSNEYDVGNLSPTMLNALQDRATADKIRRVHLTVEDSGLLGLIITSLTVECEEILSNSVESLVLRNYDEVLDVTDFFAHYRFPKLRRLDLTNCMVSSWDYVTSRTGALTNLELDFPEPGSGPTTSQLLSILASNPILQRLILYRNAAPGDHGGESSSRVPLHHLNELKLLGDSQDAMRFLHRLDHPANMDHLTVELEDCMVAEISQTIGPYFRDYLRRRDRSQNGLGIFLSLDHEIILNAGDTHGTGPQLLQAVNFMRITLELDETLPNDVREEVILDLIAHIPRVEIVCLQIHCNSVAIGNVYAQFPNLKTLFLKGTTLSIVFPRQNPDGDESILHSLRCMFLQDLVVGGGDWSPLTTFLSRRASSGNRLDTLEISWSPHMCPEVVESIRGAVQEIKIELPDPVCSFGTCS